MATNPQRSELEVFVNEVGSITIRQADQLAIEEDPIVVVHPDDISMLMRALDRAQREVVRIRSEERDERAVFPELLARGPTGSA